MFFLRRRNLYVQAAALLALTRYASADEFSCRFHHGDLTYDLSKLAGEHQIMRERRSPPTTMVDKVKFNLCADLDREGSIDERDQCPLGTRACLTTVNQKDGESDRVVSVIPLATSDSVVEYSSLSSPRGIQLMFKGPTYPDSSDDSEEQSFNLRLLCASQSSGLTFSDYDGGAVWAEWSAPEGCGSDAPPSDSDEDTPNDDSGDDSDSSESHMGSGLGYFFLLLLLAFVAYFALGAYYNYSTYGASGMDLIPHRDFWREVPYMLNDVVSHLCSAIRPRQASRGGYIAV